MFRWKTIRAQVLTAVLLIFALGMGSLATVLTLKERWLIAEDAKHRQNIMLSVLSFDLESQFGAQGFERSLEPDGRLAGVTWPEIPEFESHSIADNSATRTFGLVSVLRWDPVTSRFTRASTSAMDAAGQRVTTAELSSETVAALREGEAVTARHVIGESEFDQLLIPVFGSDRSVVGALEAAIPATDLSGKTWTTILISLVATLVCLGSASILLVVAVARALRPVARLNASMSKIADGEYTTEVPHTTMRDAVGDMARTLKVFAQDLDTGKRARDLQSSAEQEALARAEKERDIQMRVVEEISDGLTRLADGDLMKAIESPADNPFPEQYDGLRLRFNAALEQLSHAMTTVLASADNVRTGAKEIDQVAGDLSSRAETQAATLEESAAALNELSTSVRQASESAGQAEQAGRSARNQAEEGAEVMRQAIEAMEKIAESSDNVSRIIGVIDDIAFQTNLLALNAGVEAARAGEAGKGFAVVASEVRGLAQRASESARQIKELVSASTSQVNEGTKLVHATSDHLDGILDQARTLQELMSAIAAAARDQATGLDEISAGVNQLDSVTQQNAAMAEQTNAAASGLASASDELTQALAMFRLPGGKIVAMKKARDPAPIPIPATDNWVSRSERAPIAVNDFEGF
ncbi:HAMP domain-containing protein [Rhodobacterales bacterium HKCCE4037]|nr:HAMP domain-containing protein [Rhodobacterales bacterium HKCCE4037]